MVINNKNIKCQRHWKIFVWNNYVQICSVLNKMFSTNGVSLGVQFRPLISNKKHFKTQTLKFSWHLLKIESWSWISVGFNLRPSLRCFLMAECLCTDHIWIHTQCIDKRGIYICHYLGLPRSFCLWVMAAAPGWYFMARSYSSLHTSVDKIYPLEVIMFYLKGKIHHTFQF